MPYIDTLIKSCLLSEKSITNVLTRCRVIATHLNHSDAFIHVLRKLREKFIIVEYNPQYTKEVKRETANAIMQIWCE